MKEPGDMPGDNLNAGVSAPLSVTVLTGFLGAGKTTLLNRILKGEHGLRVAVLVNDFGAINIDAELILDVTSDVIRLSNGCVCCSIRDDLVAAVLQVAEHPDRPEYILLEASGVADPAGILVTFTNPGLAERVRLDSILCVVDAEQVFSAPEAMELKLWQIGCADMVILNKVDLVDRNRVAAIRAWLDDRFHRYRLVEACRGDVPLEILMSAGRLEPALAVRDDAAADSHHDDHGHDHHHAQAFVTAAWDSDAALSLAALRQTASRLPAGVYRAKGIVDAIESPDRRVILQVVGKRVDITLGAPWTEARRSSRIVTIGSAGTFDGDDLAREFDACRATPVHP